MIISKTPFRMSFFGGGTDYPAYYKHHGGAVLSTSIDKYCYLTCRYLPQFFDHKHRLVYTKTEKVFIDGILKYSSEDISLPKPTDFELGIINPEENRL